LPQQLADSNFVQVHWTSPFFERVQAMVLMLHFAYPCNGPNSVSPSSIIALVNQSNLAPSMCKKESDHKPGHQEHRIPG
jgi:hypothetical protein